MSMRKSNDPGWVAVLCRLYSGALWLYPRSHRERWGAEMRQTFRDRCREAAREGRGPASILFVDLLPDLAASAGGECFAEAMENSPMKRMLLVGLLFALLGLAFQERLSVAALSAQSWWRQQQTTADIHANDAHLVALATALEQSRRGSPDDVTAAILYLSGADGVESVDEQRFIPGSPQLSAAESAERNELLDRADAAFARALKADDRWALLLAAINCPVRAAVCAREASLARLREIDPGNGATWLAELYRALDTHDSTRARNALARFAQATRYDTHDGDMERRILSAFDKVPLPSRLDNGVNDPAATPAQLAEARRTMRALKVFLPGVLPGYKPLLDYCRTRNAPTDADRASDCLAVGKLLAQSDNSFAITPLIGLRIWLRTAPVGTVPLVQQRIRDAHWVLQQFAWDFPLWGLRREDSARNVLEWKAAWMAGGGEFEMARRLLQQHGIPLKAPPEFTMGPRTLDPAF